MTLFLVPEQHNRRPDERFDPYTESGARSILRKWKPDVQAMLLEMHANHEKFQSGITFLPHSSLKHKPWVAGAMVTLGLIEEVPTKSGMCGIVLTKKSLAQLERQNA